MMISHIAPWHVKPLRKELQPPAKAEGHSTCTENMGNFRDALGLL